MDFNIIIDAIYVVLPLIPCVLLWMIFYGIEHSSNNNYWKMFICIIIIAFVEICFNTITFYNDVNTWRASLQ